MQSRDRPRSDQRLKDGRLECVLCSGIELAVGVGPRPAFSEEEVTLGIEFPVSLKASHRPTSISKRRTAIDEIHSHSVTRQHPCGIQACGPASDDDNATR